MTPIRKTILINLAEQLDHFLWTYSGEFGGDPWPNMPTRDACLYELARLSLDILLDLLTETGRPRPQAVPPSPEQRRSQVAANHRRRCKAERRNAERDEASKLEATWPQVTEAKTPPTAEPDGDWFIPVESLPVAPTVTPRSKGGMP